MLRVAVIALKCCSESNTLQTRVTEADLRASAIARLRKHP
jgi:hypothetical protein